MGIVISPLVIFIMTGLIVFTKNDFNFFVKCLLTYLFIGLNDVGIKFFSGGKHDYEGLGWIHMFLFIGLVPSIVMLVIGLFKGRKSAHSVAVSSILLFVFLIYVHLQLFETLGVRVD